MLTLSCEHPDIERFIDVKKDLSKVTKANISVRVTDEFMEAVVNGKPFELSFTRKETGETIARTVNARELMMKLATNNWEMGEPGVLFWDRIESWNMMSEYDNIEYKGVNPCFTGDMRILCMDGYRTFEELCGQDVLLCNAEGDVVWGKVKYSGRKDTVKVIFDGSEITCTPNHIFKLLDGRECLAKDLKGKKVMPFLSKSVRKRVKYEDVDDAFVRVLDVVPNGEQDVFDFSEPNTHWGVVEGRVVHNCGEQPLPEWGSCLLGSINLSEFVTGEECNRHFALEEFKEAVRICVRALNDVLDEGIDLLPLQEQKEAARNWRQIGLGIFGLADMLIKLNVRYGSDKAVSICDGIGSVMIKTAVEASSRDGRCFPKYEQWKTCSSNFAILNNVNPGAQTMANSQLLTIAPTGTLSTMLGVSGGIEPIFANSYERKTESLHDKDVYYKVYTPIVKQYMDAHNLTDESDLPRCFVTARDIDYHDRIRMQAAWQKHIDASISSTINLPESATPEDILNIYIEAWKAGLKGVTVFRDGCKRAAVLSTHTDHNNKITTTPYIAPDNMITKTPQREWGATIDASDDVVGKKRKLMTGCGSLHCVAFFEPHTGNLVETYLSKGSNGGCQNFMIGLSRMISLAARSGVSIDAIVDQLESCGVCPSYAVRRATQHDTSSGSCCPVAVGRALKDMWREMQSDIASKSSKKQERETKSMEVTNSPAEPFVNVTGDEPKCPECGSPLIFEGGCNICKNCGWSKCS